MSATNELRQKLREATADRPAHHKFLEALLAAPDEDALYEISEQGMSGVSVAYVEALEEDVAAILQRERGDFPDNMRWPNAYRNARARYGQQASERLLRQQQREAAGIDTSLEGGFRL